MAAAKDNRHHLVTAGALAVVLLLGVVRLSGVLGRLSAGPDEAVAAEAAEVAMAQERREAQSASAPHRHVAGGP